MNWSKASHEKNFMQNTIVTIDKIDLLKPIEVAQLIGVKVQTLASWRCTGRYPELKWYQFGRKVMYSTDDVLNWLNSLRV